MRGNEAPDLSIVDKTEHNTRKEIAQDLGWSTGKTAQADYVWNHAKDQIKDKVKSGDISINQAYKEVKKEVIATETKKKRAELAEKGAMVQKDERWNVYCGDMRTWQSEKQYDFIVTDPPYPKEYLPLWGVLAMRANEWLKEGGLLIAMSGQSYLDEIYKLLSEHLTYYWTASYLTPGQPTPLRQVNVNTTWKPLLIYRKGLYKGKIFGDVFKSDGNDKENHKWGQSESGMFDIISKMCLPGQSILDPFCGAGTTGVAALKHGCYFDGLEIELENVNISKARLQSLNGG
jgi:16S rRNA G966 N2-methylase RsmD